MTSAIKAIAVAIAFALIAAAGVKAFADEGPKFSREDGLELENIGLKMDRLQREAGELSKRRVDLLKKYHLHINKDGSVAKDEPAPAAAKK